MHKTIGVVALLAVVLAGGYWWRTHQNTEEAARAFEPLNATYTIEGRSVALVNGGAEAEAAPGSAAKVRTNVFGEPVMGDLNGDGRQDAALILTDNSGGSGTFYYAAVALNTAAGTEGTNAVLLGDRIAPQNIEIREGKVIANYAERKRGEPMSALPSVGVSKYLVLDGGMLKIAD